MSQQDSDAVTQVAQHVEAMNLADASGESNGDTAATSSDAPQETGTEPHTTTDEAAAENGTDDDGDDAAEADDTVPNPLSDDDDDDDEDDDAEHCSGRDVMLGFLEPPEHPKAMLRHYFPCKVGGKPAWLNPVHLPTPSQLTCVHCGNPLVFMLQLYAPLRTTLGSHPGSFHRTLFLFCCLQDQCVNKQKSFMCFRSQLPRYNPYYPPVAPPKLEPYELAKGEKELPVLEDTTEANVHLCCVCGNPGPSSCSRCHSRRYCSRLHQVYDWKQGNHKTKCKAADATTTTSETASTSSSSSSAASGSDPSPPVSLPSLLFSQHEIVIEPEYPSDDDDDESEDGHEEDSNLTPEEREAKRKERKAKKAKDDFSRETRLYEEYKKQKAEQPDEEDEEDLAEAVSNWASPKLKDPLFQRFKDRTAIAPDQILRYERAQSANERTQPLWVSNWFQPASPPMQQLPKADAQGRRTQVARPVAPTADANDAAIPPCPHCQSPRRFEFQVLPQLLHYLGTNAASLDFANVVVYTCENSCGDGEKGFFEEFTWVQAHAQ